MFGYQEMRNGDSAGFYDNFMEAQNEWADPEHHDHNRYMGKGLHALTVAHYPGSHPIWDELYVSTCQDAALPLFFPPSLPSPPSLPASPPPN